jgi:hypothetical protein
MLFVPLFAGVEAPILGFEVMALLVAVHATGLRWTAIGLVAGALFAVHLALAAATRRDRRLTLVFSRSVRYPRYARPWPTLRTASRPAEPTFPRRLLG